MVSLCFMLLSCPRSPLTCLAIVTRDGETASGDDVQNVIKTKYNHRTVPAVFVKGGSSMLPWNWYVADALCVSRQAPRRVR